MDLLVIKKIIESNTTLLELLVTKNSEISIKDRKKYGIHKDYMDLIDVAYKTGLLGIEEDNAKETLLKLLDIRLTPSQKRSLEYVRLKAGVNMTGFKDKIYKDVASMVIDKGIPANIYGLRHIIGEGLKDFKTRGEIASKLREHMGDWSRDWSRVAHTECWDAKINGEVVSILDGSSTLTQSKEETLVFKRPAGNACNQCKKHYLQDDGVTPVVFKLGDLIAHGTNVGKKTADWVATVGVLHPNCMCPISIMPKGWIFDSDGQLAPENTDIRL